MSDLKALVLEKIKEIVRCYKDYMEKRLEATRLHWNAKKTIYKLELQCRKCGYTMTYEAPLLTTIGLERYGLKDLPKCPNCGAEKDIVYERDYYYSHKRDKEMSTSAAVEVAWFKITEEESREVVDEEMMRRAERAEEAEKHACEELKRLCNELFQVVEVKRDHESETYIIKDRYGISEYYCGMVWKFYKVTPLIKALHDAFIEGIEGSEYEKERAFRNLIDLMSPS